MLSELIDFLISVIDQKGNMEVFLTDDDINSRKFTNSYVTSDDEGNMTLYITSAVSNKTNSYLS